MIRPHVMKRDGCKVPFDSERIKEAILRAAIAAGIEDCLTEYQLVGLKRDKKRVVFFVFKFGTLKRFVVSSNSILRKISILDVLCSVTVICLLKASRRLARSPPRTLRTTYLGNILKIEWIKSHRIL